MSIITQGPTRQGSRRRLAVRKRARLAQTLAIALLLAPGGLIGGLAQGRAQAQQRGYDLTAPDTLGANPTTPAPSASAGSAAPVPNGEEWTLKGDPKKGARISPSLFRGHDRRDGDGYLDGSTLQPDHDHQPPAGIKIDVPLN